MSEVCNILKPPAFGMTWNVFARGSKPLAKVNGSWSWGTCWSPWCLNFFRAFIVQYKVSVSYHVDALIGLAHWAPSHTVRPCLVYFFTPEFPSRAHVFDTQATTQCIAFRTSHRNDIIKNHKHRRRCRYRFLFTRFDGRCGNIASMFRGMYGVKRGCT